MATTNPAARTVDGLAALGAQLRFHIRAIGFVPRALRRYPREVLRLLSQVSFGSGALAVIGGTIGVMLSLSLFTGAVVGLQGYAALNQLGTPALTGFISAYFNTREIAPLVAGSRARRRRSAAVSPHSSARCGSPRRSTHSRSWRCAACPYLVTPD